MYPGHWHPEVVVCRTTSQESVCSLWHRILWFPDIQSYDQYRLRRPMSVQETNGSRFSPWDPVREAVRQCPGCSIWYRSVSPVSSSSLPVILQCLSLKTISDYAGTQSFFDLIISASYPSYKRLKLEVVLVVIGTCANEIWTARSVIAVCAVLVLGYVISIWRGEDLKHYFSTEDVRCAVDLVSCFEYTLTRQYLHLSRFLAWSFPC